MGKILIICEKPSVSVTFAEVLHVYGKSDGYIENDKFVITWCVGHLVSMLYPHDYDEKYKTWRLRDLPFLPEKYKYGVINSVKKQFNVVNKMLHRKDIDVCYWAGDAAREGQVIEENIRRFAGVAPHIKELRIWIDSQTEDEIKRGIREAKPMASYDLYAESGIMRAIEDYAVGINFSRALSCKYGGVLNNAAQLKQYSPIPVGRVMTCVLGLVVRREREIRDFVVVPYYKVIASFDGIVAEWKSVEGSRYFNSPLLYKENGFKVKNDSIDMVNVLEPLDGTIHSLEKTISNKKPPLLFNLAELQSECSKLFKISPDETLAVAQALYDKKLATYPRTDSRYLSSAVGKVIDNNLKGIRPQYEKFVDTILNNGWDKNITKTTYVNDSKVADHYAIIPTGQMKEYSSLNGLQQSVYDLITRRFLSIFFPSAVYENIKATFVVGSEYFFSSSKALVQSGYQSVLGVSVDDDLQGNNYNGLSEFFSNHKKGDIVKVSDYDIKEGKTSPPKRYTSGSMILAMENAGQFIDDEDLRAQIKGSGIGTSATRAEIIAKLIKIKHLHLNKKTQILTPEKMGEMIYEIVDLTVPELLNPKMAASWEKGLEGILNGTIKVADYRRVLEDYVRKTTNKIAEGNVIEELKVRLKPFAKGDISFLDTNTTNNGASSTIVYEKDVFCPVCKKRLYFSRSNFLVCEQFKRGPEPCSFAIGRICQKQLDKKDALMLVKNRKTDFIQGFVSKTGNTFSAVLLLTDENKIEFDKSNWRS